ncbi:hypothetical protein ACFVUH_13860 [Kitasatospora sp. NPDC058032]|uniref:hypothetical protein n=1 Tax=Kitasatospora sp. NPDC058032 TaxID=3346307 RepID=UPI0036DBF7C5
MPDHFDRLVAKGAPGRDPAGAGAGVRVRPRLPGPFERIDALGPTLPAGGGEPVAPGLPDGRPVLALLPRSATPHPTPAGETPPAAVGAARPAAAPALPLPRTPLLLAPPIAPATARADEPPPRTGAARPAAPAPVTAAPVAAPQRTVAAEPPAGAPPAPVRPAVAPASGRRAAAVAAPGHASGNGAGTRRRPRPVERVVRVRIGRVEVRAAERVQAEPRRPAAARPAPALGLDTYLTREPS